MELVQAFPFAELAFYIALIALAAAIFSVLGGIFYLAGEPAGAICSLFWLCLSGPPQKTVGRLLAYPPTFFYSLTLLPLCFCEALGLNFRVMITSNPCPPLCLSPNLWPAACSCILAPLMSSKPHLSPCPSLPLALPRPASLQPAPWPWQAPSSVSSWLPCRHLLAGALHAVYLTLASRKALCSTEVQSINLAWRPLQMRNI